MQTVRPFYGGNFALFPSNFRAPCGCEKEFFWSFFFSMNVFRPFVYGMFPQLYSISLPLVGGWKISGKNSEVPRFDVLVTCYTLHPRKTNLNVFTDLKNTDRGGHYFCQRMWMNDMVESAAAVIDGGKDGGVKLCIFQITQKFAEKELPSRAHACEAVNFPFRCAWALIFFFGSFLTH